MGVLAEMNCWRCSKAIGVTHHHIKCIRRGERMPSLILAERMARYLGITLDDFVVQLRHIRKDCLASRQAKGWLGLPPAAYRPEWAKPNAHKWKRKLWPGLKVPKK